MFSYRSGALAGLGCIPDSGISPSINYWESHMQPLPIWAVSAVLLAATVSAAAEKLVQSPEQVLKKFSKSWDESTWRPKRFRGGYMRPDKDAGWKARMIALQRLVQHGKAAVPMLTKALKSGDAPQRILAAQALGYLAPHAPADALLEAAKNDTNAAVRLYAVDSLGMQGKAGKSVDWAALSRSQRNRDVRSHVGYAKVRNGAPVESAVVEALTKWDPKRIDSAVVGKPAPDFALKSADGKTVRLKDYRGRKTVVLVFVYGDT